MNEDVTNPASPPSPPSTSSPPPAIYKSSRHGEEEKLFLAFVADRDVLCPRCDHNLRAATQMKCMECGDDLRLAVAASAIILRWFLFTLMPGIFSGIMAVLIMVGLSVDSTGVPVEVYWCLAFGIVSGLFAIGIAVSRKRFLRQSTLAQRGWSVSLWGIHIGVFLFTIY